MNSGTFMKTTIIKVLAISLFLSTVLCAMESIFPEEEESKEERLLGMILRMNEEQMRDYIESLSIDEINEKHGETEQALLHITTTVGNIKQIKLLIKKNADVNPKSKYFSPLRIACLSNNQEAYQLLSRAGSVESYSVIIPQEDS